ncbi:MAG: endonuclease MutS2 [Candidatus Kapabacteria bacterium]|nr:endonuclease MutS2 [Candidatus Kapabacteria bacterium]
MAQAERDLLETALDELEFPRVLEAIARTCVSEAGAVRTLHLRPTMDAMALRADLDRVGECVDLIATGETIPFDRLSDVKGLVVRCRIEGNFISAPDLLKVLEALQTSRNLKSFFRERAPRCENLNAYCEPLVEDRVLEKHIHEAIDDNGTVRDNASRELQSIRREIHDLSAKLRNRLQRILKKYGDEELLQDEFITQRDGRFVLPLRVETKRSVEGIIHGVSQSGQTVFMEPAETYEMNNDLAILHGREQREIIRILSTLSAEVGAVAYGIDSAVDVLTELDTILARARFALDHGGIKPVIVDDEEIELTNVHHPILAINARRTRDAVIPLSVRFDVATRGILISGPNAGGKTVAMKAIGLTMSMAMSGIFPLGMCSMRPRRITTAIGDHQSIESNLSTFSSQIIRLRDVLSHCDGNAMVLIDEICAGTDPAEGGALAAGILDSLIERGACFVVTTHQSSLKQYALTRSSITNASLEFDDTKMQPTFRFLYGVPGNSYAFHLAKAVGLPEVVIDRATGYLGDRHGELEKSINAMQQFRREAESAHRLAAEEHAKAERLRKDYEERVAAVKQKRSSVVEDAREEAREILRKANALVENTIREVREQQKSTAEIKRDFEKGRVADKPRSETPPSEAPQAGALTPGAVATVRGTSSSGTIISIDEKGKNVMIDVNGIKFRVPLDQLDSGATSAPKERKRQSSIVDHLKLDASTSLDLRGMRADEGLRALEDFINNGILGTLTHATIIHGKGTGAMRKVVHEYLHEHPQIQSWRIGTIHEGGDGITVIEFR